MAEELAWQQWRIDGTKLLSCQLPSIPDAVCMRAAPSHWQACHLCIETEVEGLQGVTDSSSIGAARAEGSEEPHFSGS